MVRSRAAECPLPRSRVPQSIAAATRSRTRSGKRGDLPQCLRMVGNRSCRRSSGPVVRVRRLQSSLRCTDHGATNSGPDRCAAWPAMDWCMRHKQPDEMLTAPVPAQRRNPGNFGERTEQSEAKRGLLGVGFVVAFQGVYDLVATLVADAAGSAIERCLDRLAVCEFVIGTEAVLPYRRRTGGAMALGWLRRFRRADTDSAQRRAMRQESV